MVEATPTSDSNNKNNPIKMLHKSFLYFWSMLGVTRAGGVWGLDRSNLDMVSPNNSSWNRSGKSTWPNYSTVELGNPINIRFVSPGVAVRSLQNPPSEMRG